MKLTSWNVNGIRAILKKNFTQDILALNPDILCLQETKAKAEQVELPLELSHYKTYWYAAQKAGYSSTALFSKIPPLHIEYGIGKAQHDLEGRVITAEFDSFILVTVYTPNAQSELRRLPYRQEWDRCFLKYLVTLDQKKPVLVCGDLNVAHQEIDLARPKQNQRNPGFTQEERAGFDALLASGFIDTFRHFHPTQTDAYSWWSYRAQARAKNIGWRLDYFLASERLTSSLQHAEINTSILGSDHCPVSLELTI